MWMTRQYLDFFQPSKFRHSRAGGKPADFKPPTRDSRASALATIMIKYLQPSSFQTRACLRNAQTEASDLEPRFQSTRGLSKAGFQTKGFRFASQNTPFSGMTKLGIRNAICAFLLLATPALADIAQISGGMGDGEPTIATGDYLTPRKPVSLTIQTVDYTGSLAPGSLWVRTGERKLYFIQADGKATVFPIGVGREGFAWSGQNVVTKKAEWPDWRPPKEMVEREAAQGHIIPEFVKGGKANPLGAAALYIGDTQYRIHGTSAPWSIGQAVSSGCIRMLNEHIQILYSAVQLGARVVVE